MFFGIFLVIGYMVFRVFAILMPGIREACNVGSAMLGFICAIIILTGICSFLFDIKNPKMKSISLPMFLGLLAPWLFRVPVAIWEFLRGGGI